MTVSIHVPGSKSMTQRGLVIGALSSKPRSIRNALVCDDSGRLTELLRGLGASVEWTEHEVTVTPGPLRGRGERFHCGNAGTTARFGSALSLVTEGPFILDGDPRMRERPIAPLANALRLLGVRVVAEDREGFLPMRFERRDLPQTRATVSLEGSSSSQYTSALMLVAPALPDGLAIELRGEIVSGGYLEMTARMMRQAGAGVTLAGGRAISIEPGGYPADGPLAIEADWSSASFALAASFVAGIDIQIDGLSAAAHSMQGDSIFPRLLEQLREGGDQTFDLRATPDLVAPLSAAALFARGRTRIAGVAHARLKESDRVSALATELRKLRAEVEESSDGLTILPLDNDPSPVELKAHGDHRLAMAFGVIGLRFPQIAVDDRSCVSKSWPRFWDELDKIRAAEER